MTDPTPARLPASGTRPNRAAGAVLVILGLLIVLVLLFTGVSIWQSYRDSRAFYEGRAHNSSFVAAAQVRWLVVANLQALRRIADAVAAVPGSFPAPGFDLGDIAGTLPDSVRIGVFNAEGRRMLTSDPDHAPMSAAGLDYFKAVRDGAAWEIGPLLFTQAEKVFPITVRIARNDTFLGAAVAYVPASLLAQFWMSLELGAGSAVGVLRDDGWLVSRYPIPEAPLNLADDALFTDHLQKAPEGIYQREASPDEGAGRIVAYHGIAGLPLVVVVEVSTEAVAARFWRHTEEVSLIAVPVLLALLLISPWAVMLMRRDERTREELAEALEQNRVLLREIHHRVKNNLQTVASLVQLQPGPPEPKTELSRRIMAMTAVHEQIYGSDRFDHINVADYVGRLMKSLRDAHGTTVQVETKLTPLTVDVDRALPLGLILNEVVSNAFKHAFPDGKSGTIAVSLTEVTGEVILRVEDDGIGRPESSKSGMGTRLIDSLTTQLGGQSEYHAGKGTTFILSFPLGSNH